MSSSSKYELINSDFKLTRLDVTVMKLFKKLDDGERVSARDVFEISEGDISIESVRQTLVRLAVREFLDVTRIIQINKGKSYIYYKLAEKGQLVMQLHVDLQDNHE